MAQRSISLKEKDAIRRRHKLLRSRLTAEEAEEKSKKICERILRSKWYLECSVFYVYYPLNGEVDCRPVILQALADQKTVALPVCGADCGMEFHQIRSFDELEEGRFHVMEPKPSCPLVQVKDAAVLVPGVVFDICGNRYGYGKGYYDRYFARFPGLRRFAAAYENQMERELYVSGTDVQMEAVYTESRIYKGRQAV